MEKYYTTVTYKPVCECGHIFDEKFEFHREINKIGGGIKIANDLIYPYMCPECGRRIESIAYPVPPFNDC